MSIIDEVGRRLPPELATAYRECTSAPARSMSELDEAVARYLDELAKRPAQAEFLDLSTARRVGAACLALVRRLQSNPGAAHHAAVQAAVDYFLLDEDAEPDGSIIGFDDDLQVVRVTAEVLGWELPEHNG